MTLYLNLYEIELLKTALKRAFYEAPFDSIEECTYHDLYIRVRELEKEGKECEL